MFEPGLLRENYPLRQSLSDSAASEKHSLRYSEKALHEVMSLYADYLQQMRKDDSQTGIRSSCSFVNDAKGLDPSMIAREFARYSLAYFNQHGQLVSDQQIESAYALLHRQVAVVAHRSDRVLIAGMAATALCCTGMQVHLVLDKELAMPYVKKALFPVLEQLACRAQCVQAGDDEALRRKAYQAAITVVSARECAMDFLRDAVNWPQRGDRVLSKIDRLQGKKSQQKSNLMRGLPCAIFIDIDSCLIDNARTPIALTRDAHPMHEVEELKQALEMVGHLEQGQHFVLTGEGAEVAFTDLGKRQLEAWAEHLGGNWTVSHIAELMLAVAIVVVHLLKRDSHYSIKQQSVDWLVDGRLVPGLDFYSKPFLTRMVELHEECEVEKQREVAARTSYQQIFNRYVHLCGLCHSSQLIEGELNTIYGLRCGHHGPKPGNQPMTFEYEHLLKGNEERVAWLQQWATSTEIQSARLVLVIEEEMLELLKAALVAVCPELIVIAEPQQEDLSTILKPGHFVLAMSNAIEHMALMLDSPIECPLKIVLTERTASRTEDLRNTFWLQTDKFLKAESSLLLAEDDKLFTDSSINKMQKMLGFFSVKNDESLLEGRIRQIQVNKGQELFKVRQGLLNHDVTMHGLLSFSGRGLYE
jgi:hypothetical protein